MRELASGMRQLVATKTGYRRARSAPLAGLISGRAKYNQELLLDRESIDCGCSQRGVVDNAPSRSRSSQHRIQFREFSEANIFAGMLFRDLPFSIIFMLERLHNFQPFTNHQQRPSFDQPRNRKCPNGDPERMTSIFFQGAPCVFNMRSTFHTRGRHVPKDAIKRPNTWKENRAKRLPRILTSALVTQQLYLAALVGYADRDRRLGDFDFAGRFAAGRACFRLFFNASIRLIVAGSSSFSSGATS